MMNNIQISYPEITVLLLEDDQADAFLVEWMLSGTSKCALTHARRLSEAIPLIETGRFDIILLDLSLPDCRRTAQAER
jgi:CheY-like chemotaxis protein